MEREKFDRWLALAEAQLDAARRVDPAALERATDERLQLQAELIRHPLHALPEAERSHAASVARRIRAVDLRIHACGSTVIGVLDTMLPDAGPRTYGRRGQMRGV